MNTACPHLATRPDLPPVAPPAGNAPSTPLWSRPAGLLFTAAAAVALAHAAGLHQVRTIVDSQGTCIRATPAKTSPCAAGLGNVLHYLPAGQGAAGTVSGAWWDGSQVWLWVRWQQTGLKPGWVRQDVIEPAPSGG